MYCGYRYKTTLIFLLWMKGAAMSCFWLMPLLSDGKNTAEPQPAKPRLSRLIMIKNKRLFFTLGCSLLNRFHKWEDISCTYNIRNNKHHKG